MGGVMRLPTLWIDDTTNTRKYEDDHYSGLPFHICPSSYVVALVGGVIIGRKWLEDGRFDYFDWDHYHLIAHFIGIVQVLPELGEAYAANSGPAALASRLMFV